MERQAEAAVQTELERRPSTPAPAAAPAEPLSSGTLARSAPAWSSCSALVAPTSLSWKGMAVSDEFRRYAERVARGEELLPYRGQVLAQHSDAFPWGPEGRPERGRRGLRASRSPVWLLGLGALLGAALVSGVRAAVVAGNGPELTRAVSALESERSTPPVPAQQLDPESARGSVSRLLGNAEVAFAPSPPALAAAAPAPSSAVKRASPPRQRSNLAPRRPPMRLSAPSTLSAATAEAHGTAEAPLAPRPGTLPFREEAAIFERAPAPAPTALLLELAPF
jgi:hypothetical protein